MTVTRLRLPNGLTLLAEPLRHAPVVAMQAWVRVGSADESSDIAGIAHVHEHMLFKGTTRRGVGEIARTVEAAGGEINAWTSYDQTVYHLVLSSRELATGLDILADVLINSAFDSDELAREIQVVLEEVRRSDDMPAKRATNALFRQAYHVHPYRRPVIGTVPTIQNLTRERILSFYHAHYHPERTTLVVVGDFEMAALETLVVRLFGTWSPQEAVARPPRAVEPPLAGLHVELLAEPVQEARLSLGWHIPGLDHPDTPALDALTVILGHGESSRLFAEVRHRRELVNDIYAYAYTPRDPGLLMVGAGLNSQNLKSAFAATLDTTFAVCAARVSEEELTKAKMVITSEAAYQRETVQGQARKRGFFEVVADDYEHETTYTKAMQALTVADLKRVAETYLTPNAAVVLQYPRDANALTVADVQGLVTERYHLTRHSRVRKRTPGPLDVTKVELQNGAVVLLRREEGPIAAMRAVGLGGLRWENASNHGLGGLMASTWARATKMLPSTAMAETVANLGGSLSAFAGRNTVGLRGEFVASKAMPGLSLFVETLLASVVSREELERERAVVLERIRNRHDSPASVAFELFAKTLYPTHPYGLRLSGGEESLAALDAGDVVQCAQTFLAPDKLVVAVVGPMDMESTLALLTERFGNDTTLPLATTAPIDAPPTSLRQSRFALDKQQAHVIVGGMGTTVRDPDRYTLEVLTAILSGQSGRLFLELRDQASLAYSISSSSVDGLDPGYLLVHLATNPDKVPQALAGVYDHLRRLRDEPVRKVELVRAKHYLTGAHAIDLQRAGARAMLMAMNERFGLGYADYLDYEPAIEAVSAEAIQDAAARYLDPSRLVEVIVGPARCL